MTKGDGFIVYQVELSIDHYFRRINEGPRGIVTRSDTAGPGMVPFALNTGFGTDLSIIDDSAVACLRDDGDAPPPTKRARTVLKATTGDRRRAAGVC